MPILILHTDSTNLNVTALRMDIL